MTLAECLIAPTQLGTLDNAAAGSLASEARCPHQPQSSLDAWQQWKIYGLPVEDEAVAGERGS
ncbi:hypothetical protein [Candidatus Poriferisodalis sp.]|uniref:hypothetical protein n=1 Tax=Candidatus Poriferisodalis sp. TaxID=3101277 RepID=UPI003B52DC68